MALPAGVKYGQVKWKALAANADGGDADALPDAVPVSGTVVFRPSAAPLITSTDLANPVTVFPTAITYQLDTDGVLRDGQGRDYVTLLATNSSDMSPVNWTWQVVYNLNGGLLLGSFSFALPANSVVDLTTVAPVGSSNGTPIIMGPSGTLAVGTVTTLPAGSAVTVQNIGTPQAAVIDFAIPGSVPVSVTTPQTLTAGASPTVTNTGSANNVVLRFGLPAAPSVTLGTVTTLSAGSQATVTNVGTQFAPVYNFGLPKGTDGTNGVNGLVTSVNGKSTWVDFKGDDEKGRAWSSRVLLRRMSDRVDVELTSGRNEILLRPASPSVVVDAVDVLAR